MLVAYVWLLAYHRLECKALSNQNVRYLYLPSLDLVQRERVSGFLADITGSPIYNQAAFLLSILFPHTHKSTSIDCTMWAWGMCSTEL